MVDTFRETENDVKKLAELLKALGDETRLVILTMLRDGELCVCEIMDALPFSQPAVSHHLKVLRQAGFITARRQGKWNFYSINPGAIENVSDLLKRPVIHPYTARPPEYKPACRSGKYQDC